MAWSILLSHDVFWAHLCKEHLPLLPSTCRSFRSDVPQRLAIRVLFRDKPIRKATLFRLLPLSVYDVVTMRSPVNFLAAFAIAERKAGGFENCLAMMREKGWRCWLEVGEKRMKKRIAFEEELKRLGVPELPVDNALYRSAVIQQQRGLEKVVVWRYSTTDMELLPWQQLNPYESADEVNFRLELSRNRFVVYEYNELLMCLKTAMGHFFKGINIQVRETIKEIRSARREMKQQCVVVALKHQCLLVGVVEIRSWQRPPEIQF